MPPSQAAQQRRRRVARIRSTVAVVAVSAFLALWAALFVQLRTGHDPALGTASSSAASGGAASSGSASSGSTSSGSTSSGDTGSDSLPPATTSQS